MKVTNMKTTKGNTVPNQFIIEDKGNTWFQSYQSIIALKPDLYGCENTINTNDPMRYKIQLDKNYWDYSATTGRYRNEFLGEGIAVTRAKIDSGEYILTDLNS